mmetsp:Transcript_1676/g.3580  ORF Transcript_1676/g.3580 Transcript_1676/m.3580 type:complete len:272 (-) Transcript_1676:1123-1938(-)
MCHADHLRVINLRARSQHHRAQRLALRPHHPHQRRGRHAAAKRQVHRAHPRAVTARHRAHRTLPDSHHAAQIHPLHLTRRVARHDKRRDRAVAQHRAPPYSQRNNLPTPPRDPFQLPTPQLQHTIHAQMRQLLPALAYRVRHRRRAELVCVILHLLPRSRARLFILTAVFISFPHTHHHHTTTTIVALRGTKRQLAQIQPLQHLQTLQQLTQLLNMHTPASNLILMNHSPLPLPPDPTTIVAVVAAVVVIVGSFITQAESADVDAAVESGE